MAVAGSGKVGPVNQVNHTSWVAVVTPTDRPKSVRNRMCNRMFLWRCLCCHLALFDMSAGVGAFVIGLSQISSIFSNSSSRAMLHYGISSLLLLLLVDFNCRICNNKCSAIPKLKSKPK